MSEAELIQQINYTFEQSWSSMQWWAGISFGLLALPSFAGVRLNGLIVVGLTVLYGLFCAFTFVNVLTMTTIRVGALDELRLAETISEVGSAALTASSRWGGINGLIAVLLFNGTSFGTVIYLWYRFRSDKRSRLVKRSVNASLRPGSQ